MNASRTGNAVVLGNSLYAVGGEGGEGPATTYSRVDIFSLESLTWSPGPPLPTPRAGSDPVAYQGDVIVCGGVEGQDREPSATCLLLTASGDVPPSL